MKKILLQYLMLLFPVFAIAQNNATTYKDLTPKIKGVVCSFKLDDHISVIQTNVNDETFELIAINDKMEVVWRTTLNGYAIGAGKVNGQILAVASIANGLSKSTDGSYIGFLINPQNGKVGQQKAIYTSTSYSKEWAEVFFSENDFSLVIGERDNGKTLPIFEINTIETKNLTVININDKLETINTSHIVPAGAFVSITADKKNNLFVFAIQEDKTLKVSKYEKGKSESSGAIVQDIELNNKSDLWYGNLYGKVNTTTSPHVAISPADQNIVYFASTHNNRDKDIELTVSKFDFNKHTGQFVSEVLDRKHLRSIERNYVVVNKKIEKPDIGGGNNKGLGVRYIEEYNGTLLVAFSEVGIENSLAGMLIFENAIVINGYDSTLKLDFQQLVPSQYNGVVRFFASYHAANNSLYVTALKFSGFHYDQLYGQLDLHTGNWVKLEVLSKYDLPKNVFPDKNVLWFANGFVIPYLMGKGMFSRDVIVNLASYQY